MALTGAALESVVSDELRAWAALLMRQRARVRAPESCVVNWSRSWTVVSAMRVWMEEKTEDSICANWGYLFADGGGRLVSAEASCICTSPELSLTVVEEGCWRAG